MEKRVSLLDFDLNVAPPEDGGFPPPTAADGGFDLNEIAQVNDEVLIGENRDEIRAHSVTDSEIEIVGDETKIRRWKALLEASEGALSAYGGGKAHNRRRRAVREVEKIGGELAAAVVVRSTRGRTVAMPNKYKDSFIDAAVVAAARFAPINGKRKAR